MIFATSRYGVYQLQNKSQRQFALTHLVRLIAATDVSRSDLHLRESKSLKSELGVFFLFSCMTSPLVTVLVLSGEIDSWSLFLGERIKVCSSCYVDSMLRGLEQNSQRWQHEYRRRNY